MVPVLFSDGSEFIDWRYSMKTLKGWKNGDKVLCIQNAGRTSELTIGKIYTIKCIYNSKYYKSPNEEITVINDSGGLVYNVFTSRFTTIKEQRKEKIKKIKKLSAIVHPMNIAIRDLLNEI